MRVLIDVEVIADFQSARVVPQIGAVEAVEGLRHEGHAVYAVNAAVDRMSWLRGRAGFRASEILVHAPSMHEGDLLIAADPIELLAWKERCPYGQAILWHAPRTRHVEDDPSWFRAWDWEIVRWFSRRSFQLAAAV
jgi:hypothetical protein